MSDPHPDFASPQTDVLWRDDVRGMAKAGLLFFYVTDITEQTDILFLHSVADEYGYVITQPSRERWNFTKKTN